MHQMGARDEHLWNMGAGNILMGRQSCGSSIFLRLSPFNGWGIFRTHPRQKSRSRDRRRPGSQKMHLVVEVVLQALLKIEALPGSDLRGPALCRVK